jgi:hypothetical protein
MSTKSQKSHVRKHQEPVPFVDREKFEGLIDSWIESLNPRHKETSVVSRERLDETIAVINGTAIKPKQSLVKWAKNFFLVSVNNRHVLRRHHGNQKVVCREEIYDILYQNHSQDHPGMTALWLEISKEYCYIPQELVKAFVRSCSICAKQKDKKKPVTTKPIISECFMQRIQVSTYVSYCCLLIHAYIPRY